MAAPKMGPLRKITVATVYGEIDVEKVIAASKKDRQVLPLIEVYGVARKTKPGMTDLGPYVRFLGDFRAKNCDTGEMFSAPTLLLPRFYEDQLVAAMADGEVERPAEFAMRLCAKYEPKQKGVKYSYIAESLVDAQESDQMKALEERIKAGARLLADKSK